MAKIVLFVCECASVRVCVRTAVVLCGVVRTCTCMSESETKTSNYQIVWFCDEIHSILHMPVLSIGQFENVSVNGEWRIRQKRIKKKHIPSVKCLVWIVNCLQHAPNKIV